MSKDDLVAGKGAEITRLTAEVERLTIERDIEKTRADTVIASNMILLKENARLMVEIKRLRAALDTANVNCDRMASLAIDNAKDTERLRAAAKGVCWFDWSDNDDDAVEAIEKLRAALTPPAMNQEGGE